MYRDKGILLRAVSLISVCTLAVIGVTSAGHPATGHPPQSIEHVYSGHGGMPVEWSYGDIQLTAGRVPPEQLTDEERYILAGTVTSRYSDEIGLQPWTITVFSITNKFHAAHGYLPDQLTPEIIRSIPGYEEISDDRMDIYRNPLTGEWPKLNCKEHSPGDALIQILSSAEINHFAQYYPEYREIWTNNCWWNPATGEGKCVQMLSPVYFVRIYGWQGVLYEEIDFIWNTTS